MMCSNRSWTQFFIIYFRVTAFNASKFMITNREFREFVEADGYNKSEFWTDEGWKWKEFCQATHPVFWVCDKGIRQIIQYSGSVIKVLY